MTSVSIHKGRRDESTPSGGYLYAAHFPLWFPHPARSLTTPLTTVYKATKESDATYYGKIKEAEAIEATSKALGSLANVMGGPHGLLQYLMLKENTYEKLALANAKAIQGLQPKITVWNTGKSLPYLHKFTPKFASHFAIFRSGGKMEVLKRIE